MTLLETFMESKEVKKLIIQRSTDFRIPLRYVCREAAIDYDRFMSSYINATVWNKCDVTEKQFIKVLETLGINVRYQFIISKTDMPARSAELAEKYKK